MATKKIVIPELEFTYSYPYDSSVMKMIGKKWLTNFRESVHNYLKVFSEEWKKHEKDVMTEMSKTTGMKWKGDKLTCYVNNYGMSFSDPLTLAIRNYYGEVNPATESVDALIHQLVHTLFDSNDFKASEIPEKYDTENGSVMNHIHMCAVHKHILIKFFDEAYMKNRIEAESFNPDLKRAWEIVEQVGYEKLLEEIREYYA